MNKLSIIIPNLNDAKYLSRLLNQIDEYRPKHGWEVIVVDGGSSDSSLRVANRADKLIISEPGRAKQLNAGVDSSTGTLVWFLHADSEINQYTCAAIEKLRFDSGLTWGRFAIRMSPNSGLLSIVAFFMNLRSCLTGICTGDQGMFVQRNLLNEIGGIPDQALMEDIELSRKLNKIIRPDCRGENIVTSSRRWHKEGTVKTIAFMWYLRAAYYFGAQPDQLARKYYGSRT